MGVDGVYGRTGAYEAIVEKLAAFISQARDAHAEIMRFPPVMSRRDLEKNGYLKSFPNLLGCVCALRGSEADIRAAAGRAEQGDDWTQALSSADLVLTPRPVTRSIRSRRSGDQHQAAAIASMSPPIVSAMSRRRTSTGCNHSDA